MDGGSFSSTSHVMRMYIDTLFQQLALALRIHTVAAERELHVE